MNSNDRLTELAKQIKENSERARQLSNSLPKLKDMLVSKLEAQKTAIIESGDPIDLETEINLLRLRIEGVNNAVASLVADNRKLEQEKANIQ